MSRLCGIWGRPYVDLSELVGTSSFEAIDEEIVCALPRVEASYTGGSLKWMGVTAPWVNADPYADYMQVIESFSRPKSTPSATRPTTRSRASRCCT